MDYPQCFQGMNQEEISTVVYATVREEVKGMLFCEADEQDKMDLSEQEYADFLAEPDIIGAMNQVHDGLLKYILGERNDGVDDGEFWGDFYREDLYKTIIHDKVLQTIEARMSSHD